MTGTDLNISFQDTQYLSELYAKLGSLQYELANLDMVELKTRLICLVFVALIGITVGVWLAGEILYHTDSVGLTVIFAIVWTLVLLIAWWFIGGVMVDFKVYEIQRNIEATEMAIEAIKMKYGLV